MNKIYAIFIILIFAFFPITHALEVDLRNFQQEGPSGNGNWSVSSDGSNVYQSINGNPTFFVGPDTFINKQVTGKFKVETTGDDDYIGFVFGFGNSDADRFFLFDWKQGNQSGSPKGFYLTDVSGGAGAIPFGNHHVDSSGYDVLATNTSHGGWADNTQYTFTLTYLDNEIKIEMEGGAFSSKTAIFNFSGNFASRAGRFGFYNFSQPHVRYSNFDEIETSGGGGSGGGGEEDPPEIVFYSPATLSVADSYNFGNVRVGTQATETITVSNAGEETLTGNIGPATGNSNFAPTSGNQSFSLGDSESTTRTYTYNPTARGTDQANVAVTSNGGNETVALNGIGVAPVFNSSVAPGTTIDLGLIHLNTSILEHPDIPPTKYYTITISNLTSDADLGDLTNLSILNAYITGDSPFELMNFTPVVLSKGDTLELQIRFSTIMAHNGGIAPPKGFKNAVLTLVTDQNAAFGETGDIFTFNFTGEVVPEPTSLLMIGLVLPLFFFIRRKI